MGCCNSKGNRWAFQGPSELLQPLRESFAVHNPNVCIVVVRVKEMRRLPAGNHLGSNTDPYMELSVVPSHPSKGDQKQRTSMKINTRNPKWFPPGRFQFQVSRLQSTKIVMNVFHFLPVLAPVSIGDAVLHLKGFNIGDQRSHMEYKLVHQENGEEEGSVVVSVEVMTAEQAANTQEHYIYEFHRWNGEWGTLDNFLLTDPGRWSTIDGKVFGNDIDEISPKIPDGWEVVRDWMTGVTDTDPDGWEYSTDMRSNYWHPTGDGLVQCIRRRIWSRKVAKTNEDWWDTSFSDPNHC